MTTRTKSLFSLQSRPTINVSRTLKQLTGFFRSLSPSKEKFVSKKKRHGHLRDSKAPSWRRLGTGSPTARHLAGVAALDDPTRRVPQGHLSFAMALHTRVRRLADGFAMSWCPGRSLLAKESWRLFTSHFFRYKDSVPWKCRTPRVWCQLWAPQGLILFERCQV